MAELHGAMDPSSSMGVCIMLRSTGLLRVTILDVVVPGACRDIFSGSQDTLSKDHSWTLRLVISPLTVSTSQSIFAG